MSTSPHRIAIIGAGFSAHAAAIAILRQTTQPVRIALIDPRKECGGLAYGQAGDAHILNTRASQFSIIPEDPLDFVRWVRDSISGLKDAEGVEDAYLPRRLVQDYIRQRLAEAAANQSLADVLRIQSRVAEVSVQGGIYRLRLTNGANFEADIAILASGYGSERRLNFGLDPFGDMSTRRASQASRVAFVGSGLTFIDSYLRIRALGFKGEAISVSKSARLPAAHADHHVRPVPLGLAPGESLRDIMRAARARSETLDASSDWRGIINGLRAEAQPLWQSLTPADKARFDRHVRPIWDRLRHRAPPHLQSAVVRDIAAGSLRLEKGRVTATRHGFNGWTIDAERAGERSRLGPFDLVFDCSGPAVRSVHPLAAPLIAAGHAQKNPHGGLSVKRDGSVIAANGSVTPGLFALGPLGAGSLLEITAAPEIVAQSDALARSLAAYPPAQSNPNPKPKEIKNARRPSRAESRAARAVAVQSARPRPRG